METISSSAMKLIQSSGLPCWIVGENGVKELWSADRDFSRFPDLKVRNPLLSQSTKR
jgi:hypothetical protein